MGVENPLQADLDCFLQIFSSQRSFGDGDQIRRADLSQYLETVAATDLSTPEQIVYRTQPILEAVTQNSPDNRLLYHLRYPEMLRPLISRLSTLYEHQATIKPEYRAGYSYSAHKVAQLKERTMAHLTDSAWRNKIAGEGLTPLEALFWPAFEANYHGLIDARDNLGKHYSLTDVYKLLLNLRVLGAEYYAQPDNDNDRHPFARSLYSFYTFGRVFGREELRWAHLHVSQNYFPDNHQLAVRHILRAHVLAQAAVNRPENMFVDRPQRGVIIPFAMPN